MCISCIIAHCPVPMLDEVDPLILTLLYTCVIKIADSV